MTMQDKAKKESQKPTQGLSGGAEGESRDKKHFDIIHCDL